MAVLLLAAVLALSSPSGPGAAEPHLTALKDGSLTRARRGGRVEVRDVPQRKVERAAGHRRARRLFRELGDFPSIVEDAQGTLFAHWLQKSGSGTYSYDVHVTSSRDGGKTWAKSRVLNTDGKQAEHGFVSLIPLGRSGIGALWLDGRESAMQLRYADLDASLYVRNEQVLDARVCECCTTAMTMTATGPLVAYRDRSNDEVRDIGIARRVSGKWSQPQLVHADGWKIAGCPVNGPQLASRGNLAASAWFTAPENNARVNVAFSRDAGASFGKPLRVDGGNNVIGRVDVLLLNDDSALVSWIESDAIVIRRVHASGRMDATMKLAATTSARAAGFPRAVLIGKTAYFAWTDTAAKQIRLAAVSTGN